MFRKIEDFKKEWEVESKATTEFIRSLTTESLEQRIDQGGRTLGRVAWHITGAVPEMLNRTGLNVQGASDHEPIPPHPGMIADEYARMAASVMSEVTSKWTDDMLTQENEMYGQMWQKG